MNIRRVVIGIPARNEQELIAACLRSVLLAVASLAAERPDVTTTVVVALDHCTDASLTVVQQFPVLPIITSHGCVGLARDSAVRAGLLAASSGMHRTWLACTDADSEVPPNWLTEQVRLADTGIDLVVGTVEPVGEIDPVTLQRWHDRHVLAEGHEYVHGANLGVRASVWAQAGGFGALATHEDVGLVERIRAAGLHWVATDRIRVATSGRLTSRVTGGFSDYLTELGGSAAS